MVKFLNYFTYKTTYIHTSSKLFPIEMWENASYACVNLIQQLLQTNYEARYDQREKDFLPKKLHHFIYVTFI